MQKKAAIFAIKLLVTVGLFTLLFRPETFWLKPDFWGEDISFASLLAEIRAVETHNIVLWLGFAVVVKLIGMMFGVLRWRLLLKGQGLQMPFWYMVQSWFIGRTIGIFLPGTIGLDGYRLYDSSMYTGKVIKSTTVIAIEKLIGIIAMTLLVFVTFPLGYGLFDISPLLLLVFMAPFGIGAAVAMLTLLNPRIIQVCVAAIPTPAAIRNKFDQLGAAAAAYGGNRRVLLLAVLFGFLVHVGTCLMYFGTMSAIRAENTTIFDIFFTSPLMIWGTVLTPTVGGEGVREIVFMICLGAKSGTAKAFLLSHLGWWVGELVPFLIGLPIFLLRSRPAKEEMQAKLAQARERAQVEDTGLHLAPGKVLEYRERLLNCVLAGVLGGLIGGAFIGLGEAAWLSKSLEGLTELQAFWWAPLVYGLIFIGAGLGTAGGLAFIYLLRDRFPRPQWTFGLSLGLPVIAGTLVLGRFRFQRDVLGGKPMEMGDLATIAAVAVGAGVVLALLGAIITLAVKAKRKAAIGAGAGVYVILVLAGAVASIAAAPAPKVHSLEGSAAASGPNIILIAIDALRADYLPLFSEEAVAKTPNLDEFATDAIVFDRAFAQASWTKPSFATIFSGLYPEAHTATTKVNSLPDEVVTFPELLLEAGVYTKGFANNPNITAIFGFDQGFADYVDLEPDLILGASTSSSKLAAYGGLRKGWQKVKGKIPFLGMRIADFYQPAEVVSNVSLEWLQARSADPNAADAPFFLFLHYMDPHDPFMDWENPGVGYARAQMDDPDPDTFLEPMRHAYNLEIEYLDEHLGALFEGLKNAGVYDDTLIVFTSDHGEEFQDHGGWWHGQTLFDELIHVPLIMKLPGKLSAGTRSSEFARHIDIGPTILEFVGVDKAEAMHGRAVVAPDGAFPGDRVDYIYSENDFENNVLQSVRTHASKVIRANEDNPRNHAPVELYNLKEDPREQNNIAGKDDPAEGRLLELLDGMQMHIREEAAEPALPQVDTGEIEDRLGDIGYL